MRAKHVRDGGDDATLVGESLQFVDALHRDAQRFFDQHVHAGFHQLDCHRHVHLSRRGDHRRGGAAGKGTVKATQGMRFRISAGDVVAPIGDRLDERNACSAGREKAADVPLADGSAPITTTW